QRGWHGETERLCCLEVDHELAPRDNLKRCVCSLGTFEDFIDCTWHPGIVSCRFAIFGSLFVSRSFSVPRGPHGPCPTSTWSRCAASVEPYSLAFWYQLRASAISGSTP